VKNDTRYKEKHTHLLTTLRSFKGAVQLAAAGLAMLVLAVPSAMADEANYEHLSSASAPYVPTRIVDSDSMPIEGPQSAIGIGRKTLFKNPTGEEHLTILHIPPGWEGGLNHYHDFHEWAWMIAG